MSPANVGTQTIPSYELLVVIATLMESAEDTRENEFLAFLQALSQEASRHRADSQISAAALCENCLEAARKACRQDKHGETRHKFLEVLVYALKRADPDYGLDVEKVLLGTTQDLEPTLSKNLDSLSRKVKTNKEFLAGNLRRIKDRLEKQFLIDFAAHLAQWVDTVRFNDLEARHCAWLIKTLLLEKYADPRQDVMVRPEGGRRQLAAEYIYQNLTDILRHTGGPLLADTVMKILDRDQDFKNKISFRTRYDVH
jgi:hypothetical protein